MRRSIAALAFLGVLGITASVAANPAISHAFHCAQPGSSDPNLIDCPKWNADHVIDQTAFGQAIHILVVSGDPNGSVSGSIGDLARDTTGQLWVNTTGGTVWVAFTRSDGNGPNAQNAWASLGDSNAMNQGVTTDNAVRWNNVVSGGSVVPNSKVVLNTIYATAVNEPLTLVDLGTTDLQAHNVSTFPGYGYELSFGPEAFGLLNGYGSTATTANKPWLLVFGISGVELKQMLPASSFGTATPAFGGLNAYNYWKTRTLALLATANRKLAGIIITLGANDGSNGTDAAAVGANMQTLATQIRADFGSQVAIVWVKQHVSSNTPNTATVRAQMAIGIAAIPNSKLIVIDSYPINGDLLHFKADPVWDMGLQALEAMRRLRGVPARAVTQPTIIGYGTPDYNNAGGALAPRGYPLCKAGDMEAAFVAAMKNSGSATASSTWTASGWTLASSGAQAIGGQTQEFALFTRTLFQSDFDGNNGLPPAMSVTTGNDENYAVRTCIRGTSGTDGIATYAATSFGTGGVNAGGVTTTSSGDLVVTYIASQGGGASPTHTITCSNATTSPVILFDAPLVQNTTNYGLLAACAGYKATAGASGTNVVTPSITGNPSGVTVAFKP